MGVTVGLLQVNHAERDRDSGPQPWQHHQRSVMLFVDLEPQRDDAARLEALRRDEDVLGRLARKVDRVAVDPIDLVPVLAGFDLGQGHRQQTER